MEYVQSGEPVDLLLTDVQTPGNLDGLALADLVRRRHPSMPDVIVSGNSDVEGQASKLGKFIPKPYRRYRTSDREQHAPSLSV